MKKDYTYKQFLKISLYVPHILHNEPPGSLEYLDGVSSWYKYICHPFAVAAIQGMDQTTNAVPTKVTSNA